MPSLPSLAKIFALVGMLLAAIPAAPVHAQTLWIDEIKANYLEGFVDFVTWQGDAAQESVTIGVMGSPELARILERASEDGERARRLSVARVSPGDELSGLDVLYVGSGYKPHWPELRKAAARENVLLVGDEEGFVRSGGCIEFVFRKNRVRFIVSVENIEKHGIEVSSKLSELSLRQP